MFRRLVLIVLAVSLFGCGKSEPPPPRFEIPSSPVAVEPPTIPKDVLAAVSAATAASDSLTNRPDPASDAVAMPDAPASAPP